MIGRVVSTKMKNTAVVIVERVAKHPLYKKTYIQSKKYSVHASLNVKDGDMVEIVKIRPISKKKHWSITKVIGKNLTEITEEKLKTQAEEIIAEVMPEAKEEIVEKEQMQSDKPKAKKEILAKVKKEKGAKLRKVVSDNSAESAK